jgi:hypothetical protein
MQKLFSGEDSKVAVERREKQLFLAAAKTAQPKRRDAVASAERVL